MTSRGDPTPPPILSHGPDAGAAGRPIRRRFVVDGRVRSGCVTCKKRKKKCDGLAEGNLDGRCQSCVRLGLVCEQMPLRRVAPRPPRRKVRDGQLATKVGGGNDTDDDDEDDDGGDEPTSKPSSPRLATNANALTPPPASDDDAALLLSRSRPPSAPASSGDWNGIERLLLRYFLDHVAPLCSILQGDGNSFCSVLLPMAIVDPSLLQALFAYASVHFDASAADPVSSAMPESHLKFETQVARGVADAIKSNAVTEATVACALVISTAEVIGGDTSRWPLHLRGAGHLINHLQPSRLLRTTDGAFLLKYFAYHDLMASLSTGRRTLIDGVYWVNDVDAVVDAADSFMGLGHHIFRHLAVICAFVADTSDLDFSSCSDRRSREALRAEDMAQTLRSQDLHLQVDTNDTHIKALIHHAEAFRFSCLFYLYRHLLRFGDAAAVYKLRMDDCVQQILAHVSEVPSNLFCEIGLLFPLFMVGIGSNEDAGKVQYVRKRLTCIETWTKFKHVRRARELLDLLWEKGRTDWEILLRELDWSLSLA